jgi:hypothetical protein
LIGDLKDLLIDTGLLVDGDLLGATQLMLGLREALNLIGAGEGWYVDPDFVRGFLMSCGDTLLSRPFVKVLNTEPLFEDLLSSKLSFFM